MNSVMTKRQLVGYVLRCYRITVCLALLAMICEAITSLLQPWPLKFVIDSALGSHPLAAWLNRLVQPLFGVGKTAVLYFAVTAAVVIAIVNAISSYLDSYLTKSVGIWFARDLRGMIFHHLEHLSLSYYEKQSTGHLISTLTTDVNAIQTFVATALLGILVDLMTLFGMIFFMLYLDWQYTMIALIITPFLLIYISRLMSAVKEATREVRKKQSELMSLEQETLTSMLTIQAFGREDFEEKRFQKHNLDMSNAAIVARRKKAMIAPMVNLVMALGSALVLWFGARQVIHGQETVGDLVVFLAYLARMFKPIQDLSKMGTTIAQAWVGLERIQEILAAKSLLLDGRQARPANDLKGHIEFDQVTFAYTSEQPVLQNISFSIEASQFVGLVGPSGHGKSTIVELIARFYDPQLGKIKVDGQDIRQFTISSLRDHISLVPQETVLFHDTFLENIRYGHLESTRGEVVAAAQAANVHQFIDSLPQGYETLISERGVSLSGGQRQRIAIARAILRNTPIWIFDEPTANLDATSENLLMQTIQPLVANKTFIIIAHRLSTVQNADVILVVQDGVIVEQGNHCELMDLQSTYAELYTIQHQS